MYVLHHADKPELYADLPADPRSARWWRCGRACKPLVLAMAATAAAGFLHYIGIGRNETNDEEEEEAEHEAKKIEEEQRP
jgi:formate dehydrogenase iron-sulfur subunit